MRGIEEVYKAKPQTAGGFQANRLKWGSQSLENQMRGTPFRNDLVGLKDDPSVRGHVTQSNSPEEFVASRDEENSSRRASGLVRVCWLSSTNSDRTSRSWVNVDKLTLLDRKFQLGELVSSAKGEQTGVGKVIGFSSTVTIVNTLTGKILGGVRHSNLNHVSPLDQHSSTAIVYQGWLGWVKAVDYRYILKKEGVREDDSIICVTYPQLLTNLHCQPVRFRGECFTSAGVEVGQRLTGHPLTLTAYRKGELVSARVIRKSPQTLEVLWDVSRMGTQLRSPPPSKITGLQIRKALILPGVRQFDFQIGDLVCFGAACLEEDLDDDMAAMSFMYSNEEVAEERYPWVIVERTSTVEVAWQTGVDKQAATSLSPRFHQSDHDFWPGQLVRHHDGRLGQVLKVDPRERTCDVLWMLCHEEEKRVETDLSIYQLSHVAESQLQPGDVVVFKHQGYDVEDRVGRFTGRYVGGEAEVLWATLDRSYVEVSQLRRVDPIPNSMATSPIDWYFPDSPWECLCDYGSGDSSDRSAGGSDLEGLDSWTETSSAGAEAWTVPEDESYQDSFPGFFLEEDAPEDHWFLHATPKATHQFLKRMHWEHGVLRANLPKGIWVRGFGSRLDLLRVVIIGPQGTPYAGGTYCFDLFMDPEDFPASPPKCHFWRWVGPCDDEYRPLNPNLYPSGRVCLSLLGTWEGSTPQERWSPASSLLQLAVSLQSLVLVKNPFFNEAGYDRMHGSPEATRYSDAYNEHAFLLSLMTIPVAIKTPPTPLEAPLRDYYAKTLPAFLSKLRLISEEPLTASALSNFSLKPISNGCRSLLKCRIAELETAYKFILAPGFALISFEPSVA
ncbi:hypothetical protein L0F63_006836, partial [Massospora cicadina]